MELTQQLILNTDTLGLGTTVNLPQKESDQEFNSAILTHNKSFESSLNALLSNDHEESQIQKARAILGESVINVPDEELSVYITEFQYLLDEWLDAYEIVLFNGKTLKELQGEG